MNTPITRRQALGLLGALALPLHRLGAQPAATAPAAVGAPDLGNLFGVIDRLARERAPRLSFLNPEWSSLEAWKSVARPEFLSRLSYEPAPQPLSAREVRREDRDGFTIETLRISATSAYDLPAKLLLPAGRPGRRPAVIALHCHSSDYSWGHEKVLGHPDDSAPLIRFRQRDGRPWAEALARRGYVVIVIDSFYFGERRLRVEELDPAVVPDEVRAPFQRATTLPAGSAEQLEAVDAVCRFFEHPTAKALFAAGFTWPGLLVWDDRRTLDYLASRPEVDPDRIGCAGLSLGGIRSALLAAADPRIKAACVAGWMSEFGPMRRNHLRHTWMAFVPGLHSSLDLPDAAALHAPGPLFVQQCRRDRLFPMAGMQGAVDRLSAAYAKAGVPERFRGAFYDEPHSFTPAMQEECFAWLDRWL